MSYDDPDYSRFTRDALTPGMKDKIKYAVDCNCEKCRVYGKELLEVHHIEEVFKADGSYDLNNPSNLIVLCRNCHVKVHRGLLNQAELHDIVYKRPDYIKNNLDKILENRNRVMVDTKPSTMLNTGSNISASPYSYDQSPNRTYHSDGFLSDLVVMFFGSDAFSIFLMSSILTALLYMVFSNWIMTGIKNWLIEIINPNGLSATITETILGILFVIIFLSISVLITLVFRYIIKKVGYRKSLDFVYDNPTLYNFFIKGDHFVFIISIIIFIIITILPSGILSYQVSAGESGLFENLLLGTTSSLLDFTINTLAFITTIIILFIISVVLIAFGVESAKNRY